MSSSNTGSTGTATEKKLGASSNRLPREHYLKQGQQPLRTSNEIPGAKSD
jgi:hypothetical protein